MNTRLKKTINLTILSNEASDIAEALQKQLKDNDAFCDTDGNAFINVAQVTSNPNDIAVNDVTVLLADPDLAASIIDDCSSLIWCQSTWAGNAPLLRLSKTDYVLTGLKGVFGKLMREYVFAYLLYHARNISSFEDNQRMNPPKWEALPRRPLNGQTLGIIGIGSIGQALIPVAHALGMKVVGVNRSGNTIEGVEKVYKTSELTQFATHADHIVNLMPDTAETENLISYNVFTVLKPHSVFINAGRGNAVDETALVTCLDSGKLAHAVLDVFKQEPLAPSHPFWSHPKISISAHTAAESQPVDIADVFLHNAERFITNQPLHYQFDFQKGY